MLKLIEPSSHYLHMETIDSFLNLLEHHHGVIFSPESRKNATFLIASAENISPSENAEGGVYGGAILHLQKIASSLDLAPTDTKEETVIKLTSAFQPKGDEYWVARICLYLEQGASAASILETQDLCHGFYKELYQAFKEFGEEQGINYLAYTLRVAETNNTKSFECWPRHLRIAPAGSHYDYIHGLLSLNGKHFKSRQFPKFGRQS